MCAIPSCARAQEAAAIKEREEVVAVAAARAEAQLARASMVEQAREVSEQQAVAKAGGSVMELLGLKPEDLGM